jgi:hypothetical protein
VVGHPLWSRRERPSRTRRKSSITLSHVSHFSPVMRRQTIHSGWPIALTHTAAATRELGRLYRPMTARFRYDRRRGRVAAAATAIWNREVSRDHQRQDRGFLVGVEQAELRQ